MVNTSSAPSTATAPKEPTTVWTVEVESTDYVEGKKPVMTVITRADDELLDKMQGHGWRGYATVKRDGASIGRSMHVSATQARELILQADRGEEPRL